MNDKKPNIKRAMPKFTKIPKLATTGFSFKKILDDLMISEEIVRRVLFIT